jgi:heparin binding hemagglutinin HbhA
MTSTSDHTTTTTTTSSTGRATAGGAGTRELPAPFYAVAGAGDLAYQRLRKLPEAAERSLRVANVTAATMRKRIASGESRLNRDRIAADLARLRESAQRGAHAFVAGAAVAQERAVTGYRHLVAHGEQVIAARNGSDITDVTDVTDVPPAEIEPPHTTGS